MQKVLKAVANNSKAYLKINDTDYQKNGIWYCGVCNEQKEMILPNTNIKVACLCKCQQKELEKEISQTNQTEFETKYKKLIDLDYQNVYFKDILDLDKYYIKEKKFVEKIEDFIKLGVGLYVYGDFGNGKTMIASAMANELFAKGYKVYMTTFNNAVARTTETVNNSKINVQDVKNKILGCDIIILDDFGACRETEYQIEQIFNLVNFLYTNRKIVVMTSNINRSALGNEIGAKGRIYDRVIQMTYGHLIEAPRRRKEIAREKMQCINDLLGD